MYRIVMTGVLLLILAGCQTTIPLDKLAANKKQEQVSNLTLDQAIKQGKLEQADNLYLDFRGKHPESNKIPGLMLRLAKAHMEKKEYLLARYYAESYITDYPDGRRVDQAWYLRLKALFLHFTSKGNEEALNGQFQQEAEAFIANPAYRKYHAKARAMLKKSQQIQYQRNEALAKYYEKQGKHKAAAFYREKNKALPQAKPSAKKKTEK